MERFVPAADATATELQLALDLQAEIVAHAMAYFLPRWEMLCIFTRDTRLNIDNNLEENAIRPVRVGCKNYLFASSHEAVQRAAMVYSLLEICKLHNINHYYWLRDVLENMRRFTTENIEGLLPKNLKKLPEV